MSLVMEPNLFVLHFETRPTVAEMYTHSPDYSADDADFDVKFDTDSIFDDFNMTTVPALNLHESPFTSGVAQPLNMNAIKMEEDDSMGATENVRPPPSASRRAHTAVRPLPIVFPSFEAMLNEYQKMRNDPVLMSDHSNQYSSNNIYFQPESWFNSSTNTPSTSQGNTPRTAYEDLNDINDESSNVESTPKTTPRDNTASSTTPRSLTPRTPRDRDRNSRNLSLTPRTPRTASPRTPSGTFTPNLNRPRSVPRSAFITQSLDLLNLNNNTTVKTARPKSIDERPKKAGIRPQSTQVMSPHLLQALQNSVNSNEEARTPNTPASPTPADNLRIEKTLKLRKGRYRRSNKVHGYENLVTEFKFN